MYPSTAQLTLNSATIPENIQEILNPVVNVSYLKITVTESEIKTNLNNNLFLG